MQSMEIISMWEVFSSICPKFDMQHDHILKKLNFGLRPTLQLDPVLQTKIPFDMYVCLHAKLNIDN